MIQRITKSIISLNLLKKKYLNDENDYWGIQHESQRLIQTHRGYKSEQYFVLTDTQTLASLSYHIQFVIRS